MGYILRKNITTYINYTSIYVYVFVFNTNTFKVCMTPIVKYGN